ncbi:hypothetical protein BJ165DRAFT_1418234 [Panaeolus papilionaceus]|nr:hypothetical protein BJ165DRAFT_1418234 [Panaeolus papilionaceus]
MDQNPSSFTDYSRYIFPSKPLDVQSTSVVRGDVASSVIQLFSEAYVTDTSSIGPKSHEVLSNLAQYINRQMPEIQSWLIDSAKTKIGTDANCLAASQRKPKAAVRLYPCYWCLRPFRTKNNLGNHVRAHMNLKISRCPCGIESTNVTIPRRHSERCNAIAQDER